MFFVLIGLYDVVFFGVDVSVFNDIICCVSFIYFGMSLLFNLSDTVFACCFVVVLLCVVACCLLLRLVSFFLYL